VIADPNALSPGRSTREPDVHAVARTEHGWVAPFVMATYNTRIVRRSAQLLGYGPGFAYKEVQRFGNPLLAAAWTGGLGALAAGLAFPPSRLMLDRFLPGPGDGPSEQARANGYFRVAVHADGHRSTVAAKGDPGYAATAVMMGESALALALNPGQGGVLTPAVAIGAPLVERLRAANFRLSVD
jgi:short subunit dehydrogenase-like uncharacterized protein